MSAAKSSELTVIGGGLAGSEAAWQAAERGIGVHLYEMRPTRFTPAHKTDHLAELVCSNSLRSEELTHAVGLLKEELRRAGSLIMEAAAQLSTWLFKELTKDERFFGFGAVDEMKFRGAVLPPRDSTD